jgi:hypothetical protein
MYSGKMSVKHFMYAVWLLAIIGFAVIHLPDLRADFPNRTPWMGDAAKYTDEGWWGNAAISAHLTGNWYVAGDLNDAPAAPAWPFLEWIAFSLTGVTVEAARGLAVFLFFVNLLLTYFLLRGRQSHWMAMIALTLIVTSPFLYCFSRLAILEPLLLALTLGALNLAVRLHGMAHPVRGSALLGLLIALMILTKPTAIFLVPAVAWASIWPLRGRWHLAARCALTAAGVSAALYSFWIVLVISHGLLPDFLYLFAMNQTGGVREPFWPLVLLLRSLYLGIQVDKVLLPLAGVLSLAALSCWRRRWASELWEDPVFGASILAVAGYMAFFVLHIPELRYFAISSVFCFIVLAMGAGAMLRGATWTRRMGWVLIAMIAATVVINGRETLGYVTHPSYTFVNAAEGLTRYIDQHPNGRRIVVSDSGDDITLITHVPALCGMWGTQGLASKLTAYQPGWYATWNRVDPRYLEEIHQHFSIEQVASFSAFDQEDNNKLVLFKLHPLGGGEADGTAGQDPRLPLRADKIEVPVIAYEDIRRERIRTKIMRRLRGLLGALAG